MSRSALTKFRSIMPSLRAHGVSPKAVALAEFHMPRYDSDPEVWLGLGSSVRRQENYHASEEVYQAALELHPDNAKLWTNYAILLLNWNRLREAVTACEKALKLDPSVYLAHSTMGRVHELLHEYEQAIEFYEQALALRPRDPVLHNNRGCCYLGLGQETLAQESFERALKIDPTYENALFNTASLHMKNQRHEDARPLVDRLRRLCPDDRGVEHLIALLESESSADVKLPGARKLDSNLPAEVQQAKQRLAGSPKSLFISYGWPNPDVKAFALRLASDLEEGGFDVVLDRRFSFGIGDLLILLGSTRNVLVINDTYYAESCLLGKVPVSVTAFPYPSFALSDDIPDDTAEEVHRIAEEIWAETKEAIKRLGEEEAARIALEESRKRLMPGVRVFVEGWRIDEIQQVFHDLGRYRSLSVAYSDGAHYLAGHPIFDFSLATYYDQSLRALIKRLDHATQVADTRPAGRFGDRAPSGPAFPDSKLHQAMGWTCSGETVVVIRPDISPDGGVGSLIQRLLEWRPNEASPVPHRTGDANSVTSPR